MATNCGSHFNQGLELGMSVDGCFLSSVSDVIHSDDCVNDLKTSNVYTWSLGYGDTNNTAQITLHCGSSDATQVETVIDKHFKCCEMFGEMFGQDNLIINISIMDHAQEVQEKNLKKQLSSWNVTKQQIIDHLVNICDLTDKETTYNEWFKFQCLITKQIEKVESDIKECSRNKIIKPFRDTVNSNTNNNNNNSWWRPQWVDKLLFHQQKQNYEIQFLILINHPISFIKLC